MAALPYLQLYVADYLADTMHLTTEEHGAYLLLIMNYWQTGKPIQEDRIQAITRLSNGSETDVINSLREFFEVDNGLWHHKRIDNDLIKVRSKSKQASRAGKASAKKRWGSEEKVTGVITDVKKALQRNGNHTDTEKDTELKKHTTSTLPLHNSGEEKASIAPKSAPEVPVKKAAEEKYRTARGKVLKGKALERYEQFWNVFSYRRDKAKAADSWFRLEPMSNELFEEIIKGAKRAQEARSGVIDAGNTPQYAQGWLTGRRWEDEIVGVHTTRKGKIISQEALYREIEKDKSIVIGRDVVKKPGSRGYYIWTT